MRNSGTNFQRHCASPKYPNCTSRGWTSVRAATRAGPRIVAGRLAQCARGASRAPTGPLGRQLTDTLVEHRSLAPSPSWAGRMGRVDRAARVAKGQRGAQSMSSGQAMLLFQPPRPAATISKMALKPAQGGGRRVKKETHLRGYNAVVLYKATGQEPIGEQRYQFLGLQNSEREVISHEKWQCRCQDSR
jgi:hypothetical protein